VLEDPDSGRYRTISIVSFAKSHQYAERENFQFNCLTGDVVVLNRSGFCKVACVALLFSGASTWAIAQTAADTPPPAVETTAVKLAPVARNASFVGTVASIQQVNLVPRVEGILTSVNFQEGAIVTAGLLLFEIEKDTYQANLDGAKANVEGANATLLSAQANLSQAESTLARQNKLLASKAVAQETVDQAATSRDSAQAQVKQAQAQIDQAQSQVKLAELNLSYTDIKTPIAGRIGKTQMTAGNLVSPSTGVLATVIQMDPIRVVFSISDREYLDVIDRLKPTEAGFESGPEQYHPSLQLPDGTDYDQKGKITFIDNKIDAGTGTIAVYAEFPNPKLQLVPGQFVSVSVEQGTATELPVVPASAVQQDRDGNYVFVLGEGNLATIRRVVLSDRVGEDWAVESGLANGEVVISSGIQKIKPGIVVSPQAAKLGN
jgi:membrane fusion protein (multidrug efflux system)